MIEYPIIIWYRSKEPSMKALRDLDMIPELFEQKTKKSTKIFFFFNTIFYIDQRDGYLRIIPDTAICPQSQREHVRASSAQNIVDDR